MFPLTGTDLNMAYERARVTVDDAPSSPVTHRVIPHSHVTSLHGYVTPLTLMPSVPLYYSLLLCLSLQSNLKKSVTMLHTPSEVFHYTDNGGHSDAILLSKSSTVLQAAKKDLLGIIQLQVRGHKGSVCTLCSTHEMCHIV